jgi:hypothetical protein
MEQLPSYTTTPVLEWWICILNGCSSMALMAFSFSAFMAL